VDLITTTIGQTEIHMQAQKMNAVVGLMSFMSKTLNPAVRVEMD
jgi:hypothetical protein